ncbi:MAG TPA: response regulator [Opitutaceae bacterium]|nr:response regulator [Opitutaceae bacterium]
MHFSSDTHSPAAGSLSVDLSPREAPPPAQRSDATWWGYEQPLSMRVLVIDDDREVRQLSANLMAGLGFEVDTADDGETAWKAICFSSYDLIITDNDMPRLSGLELIRRMRSMSLEVPCILVSGMMPGPEEVLAEVVKPGAVLAKPFKPAALMHQAEDLLVAQMERILSEKKSSLSAPTAT